MRVTRQIYNYDFIQKLPKILITSIKYNPSWDSFDIIFIHESLPEVDIVPGIDFVFYSYDFENGKFI